MGKRHVAPSKPALVERASRAVTAVMAGVAPVTYLVFQEADPLREWGGLHLGVNQEVYAVGYLLFPHLSSVKAVKGDDVCRAPQPIFVTHIIPRSPHCFCTEPPRLLVFWFGSMLDIICFVVLFSFRAAWVQFVDGCSVLGKNMLKRKSLQANKRKV